MAKKESNYIVRLLKHIRIPQNRILFLHVELKGIKSVTGQSYKSISHSILDSLQLLFQPKAILVPSFTYSFTKSGIFHRLFSKSEVGRFSEEFRQRFAKYRTSDPIFSVVDATGYLSKERGINYQTAFGKNSLFRYLNDRDCVIINVGLEELISTQLHYIEKVNNVSYRYDKVFEGVVYHDEKTWQHIRYRYYVRDLEIDPHWNRRKIQQCLIDAGVLHVYVQDDIKISWISAYAMLNVISNMLSQDSNYLIS